MATDQPGERYSWLEASAIRNASDLVLGVILLVAAAAAILDSRALSFGTWGEPDAGFFPTLVAWLLAVVGILLLARGALGRAPQMRWGTWQIVLVAAISIAASLGWLWGVYVFVYLVPLFGPQEYVALLVLALSVAIAFARLSRLRAAGMVLLGLLLAVVGLDGMTGKLRLTMGLEQLLPGVDYLVLAPGLILVAESLVCLFSPALLLATYTRRIAGRRDPAVSTIVAIGMRVMSALIVAGSFYLAFKVGERVSDIGFLWLFGALGVACKVLEWNRLVLLLGFSCSEFLEKSMIQTMLIWGGDPTGILRQPVGATMLGAAGCILIVALGLSLRRALSRNAVAAAR